MITIKVRYFDLSGSEVSIRELKEKEIVSGEWEQTVNAAIKRLYKDTAGQEPFHGLSGSRMA